MQSPRQDSRTETNVASSQLTHVPTNVMSITTDTTLESDAEPTRPSVEMPWADARAVPESPPSYEISRAPTGPVIYTFSPLSETSTEMVLQPSVSSPDARPLFYTTVTSDRWVPWKFKTALWRRPGGVDLVGALQWGEGKTLATVNLDGRTLPFKQALASGGAFYTWMAGGPQQRLQWMWARATQTVTCKLWPNTIAELKTNAAGLVELQLWPGAFAPDLLEHVVLSAVVVQCYVQSGELLMPRWAT